ncbi:MAG: cation-translocating P-type ATPase [Bdellovibrionaceae bacterium]|nr:cation-translocating P-type ATPase [Pseudobdellovibrionaceae bacterium]
MLSKYSFYIEGVSCSACLRKIYDLRSENKGIELSVNMSQSLLDVSLKDSKDLQELVRDIEMRGFKLHPMDDKKKAIQKKNRENQADLIKIATAAICAGNIMLFSVSIYSGAKGDLGKFFEWLSLFLFLPVLFYSAIPFYKNSLVAIRQKKLSIDIPLAVAIVLGAGLSAYNILYQMGQTYFDSLAILVFLILSSRYFLKKVQQKYLGISYLKSFLPQQVNVRSQCEDSVELKDADQVQLGDEVIYSKGNVVSLDGQLISQKVLLNNSVITGESLPVEITENQTLFAGAMVLSDQAVVKVTKKYEDSRISKLLAQLETEMQKPSQLTSFTDRASSLFVISLFIIGILFSAYYVNIDPQETINRFLALIILACPCAIALGVPLVQSLSLMKSAKNGIIIKNAEVFERFLKVKNVVFDKTGTLTSGQFRLIKWEKAEVSDTSKAVLFQLEEQSSHPLANAVKDYVWENNSNETLRPSDLQLTRIKEVPGEGVSGYLGEDFYEFKSYRSNKEEYTAVGLYRNAKLDNVAYFGDEIKSDAAETVAQLKSLGLNVFMLSGDNASAALNVAHKIGISSKNVMADLTPEQKNQWIKSHPYTLMMGDGVNDSLAMASSYLSVAATGSMESTLKASDVFLVTPRLNSIFELRMMSQETLKVVVRNLVLSVIYNLVGASLALLGFISPLVAAVLMPISSMVVLASSLLGTSKLREISRLYKKNPSTEAQGFDLSNKLSEAKVI